MKDSVDVRLLARSAPLKYFRGLQEPLAVIAVPGIKFLLSEAMKDAAPCLTDVRQMSMTR